MVDGMPVNVTNIFCIGRNYAAHIKELGNQQEAEPIVFLKPLSALSFEKQAICLPDWSHDIQYEAELVVLIGKSGKHIEKKDAFSHVAGYGLGLDLTARDHQTRAKAAGLPWTLCKGFDQSACLSRFIPASALPTPEDTWFSLSVNGERRQLGKTTFMLFDLPTLIAYLSKVFTLSQGDLIFTGTPEGVSTLFPGDHLLLKLEDKLTAEFVVTLPTVKELPPSP